MTHSARTDMAASVISGRETTPFFAKDEHLGCPNGRDMGCLTEPEDFLLYLRHANAPQFNGQVTAGNHDREVDIRRQGADNNIRQAAHGFYSYFQPRIVDRQHDIFITKR